MPMYDFACSGKDCPEPEFESLQKMDTKTIVCPSCGSEAAKKDVAELRRIGWYANASSLRFHFNWINN